MATHVKKLFIPIWHHPGFRTTGKLGLDALGLAVAWGLAMAAQSGQPSLPSLPIPLLSRQALAWMAVALASNLAFRLPSQHFRHFGRRDQGRVLAATGVLALASLLLPRIPGLGGGPASAFPGGTPLLATLATGLVWMALRMGVALLHERRRSRAHGRNAPPAPADRVLIAGAGHAGLLILEELARHPELGHQVVGLVDDAPDKLGIRIAGVQVLGRFEALPALIRRHGAGLVILAIPSASGLVIRRLSRIVTEAGAKVRTVPGLFNLLGSQSWAPVIQDVAIEDLLRREPVHLDQTALGHAIEGSVVLITGGGGSIGSELARQVAFFRPARIVLLGRGENSLWEAERRMHRLFPDQPLSIELCDIRNRQRLKQAFQHWRPEIVFHAAAHKHVPYLEAHPAEGVLNNVLGTRNVVQATQAIGARTFVNISTDKAVNPTSVLGATKFLAECVTLDAAATAHADQRFVSVRFGNVLGSRGSVIPVFRDQIKRGGPLTITHPAMTRYFMTIPEASQLVLQAGLLGGNGKIFALDMGAPVKIGDLARDMARLSGLTVGQDIQIQVSGIRPGEKLFEEIFQEGEQQASQVHPKVFEAVRLPIEVRRLQEGLEALAFAGNLGEGERQRELLRWLKQLVPSYRPSPIGLGGYDSDGRPGSSMATEAGLRRGRRLSRSPAMVAPAAPRPQDPPPAGWKALAMRILTKRSGKALPLLLPPWRVS